MELLAQAAEPAVKRGELLQNTPREGEVEGRSMRDEGVDVEDENGDQELDFLVCPFVREVPGVNQNVRVG